MSRKIIGITVGSQLPKPNLMQTDPRKGDYVKGKEEFLKQFNENGGATDEQIAAAVEKYLKENPPTSSGLPSVTEEDDGKILKVVDGEWVADVLPVYDGAYSVTPAVTDQTLYTAQKMMDADIKISKIPYAEVSNNSGGTTATIGGN